MGLKVIYLDIATSDLKSIYDYISHDSKKYAKLEVKKIKAFCESLTSFPFKGKYFGSMKNIEIFSIVFRNYIIFYYIIRDKQISILTIHHHARLISNNPAFKNDDE